MRHWIPRLSDGAYQLSDTASEYVQLAYPVAGRTVTFVGAAGATSTVVLVVVGWLEWVVIVVVGVAGTAAGFCATLLVLVDGEAVALVVLASSPAGTAGSTVVLVESSARADSVEVLRTCTSSEPAMSLGANAAATTNVAASPPMAAALRSRRIAGRSLR
jgi:hypothetical protein